MHSKMVPTAPAQPEVRHLSFHPTHAYPSFYDSLRFQPGDHPQYARVGFVAFDDSHRPSTSHRQRSDVQKFLLRKIAMCLHIYWMARWSGSELLNHNRSWLFECSRVLLQSTATKPIILETSAARSPAVACRLPHQTRHMSRSIHYAQAWNRERIVESRCFSS